MEPPEWVRIVSHGTAEELREFIRRNPGFDWDGTTFDKKVAFEYIVEHNTFPLTMLDVLYTLGGARFDRAYNGIMTPLRYTITLGLAWVTRWLLERDVPVKDWLYLVQWPTETILEHSTALTLETVVYALDYLSPGLGYLDRIPENATTWRKYKFGKRMSTVGDQQAALMSWRVSHNRRQAGAACVVWVLSRPLRETGSWPDMAELVSRCLMETRVKDW